MFAPHDVRNAERVVAFVRALRRRVRAAGTADAALVAAVSSLAVAVAGAAVVAGPRATILIGAFSVGAALGVWRWLMLRRTWRDPRLAAAAEARLPALRNQFVTALELAAYPERASPRIRAHVNAYVSRVIQGLSADVVRPRAAVVTRAIGAALALLLTVAVSFVPRDRPATPLVARTGTQPARTTMRGGISHVEARVIPPAYTGAREETMADPLRIEALAGSTLTLRVATDAASTSVEYAGAPIATVKTGGTASEATFRLDVAGVLSIGARDGTGSIVERRIVPVIVRPDAPPRVVIEQPQSDLVLANAAERVRFATRATDDLALASLTLHYTRVTGSGEQYEFDEGELPLAMSREEPRRWQGQSVQAPVGLGLREGDLLVVYARAADRRPGAQPSVSDSYIIEIGKPQRAISGGFAVPADEDRTAISLSALIQKTERLHAQRAQLAPASFAEQASALAVEQRMVRTETLFLMGAHGDVEDEEEEAEHSNEIQEGRLENRGQVDLRTATRLMSAAERSLLLADTGGALPPQRAALSAIQRALSKQRYFLRTLPVRSQIDPSRRLTGDLSSANGWTRQGTQATNDARLAAIRGILARLPHAGTDGAAALAADVLALDPASPALQEAARGLMTLATANAARRREVMATVATVLEAQAAHVAAAPAVPPSLVATPLRGAFADALRQAGDRH